MKIRKMLVYATAFAFVFSTAAFGTEIGSGVFWMTSIFLLVLPGLAPPVRLQSAPELPRPIRR